MENTTVGAGAPALVDLRRFFGYVSADRCTFMIVARSPEHALELLADLDAHPHPSELREMGIGRARKRRVRPDDDSPARVLADAPMGSIYSSEA